MRCLRRSLLMPACYRGRETAYRKVSVMNGTKLRRLFLCRVEFIRPLAVGGYPHRGYIRDDRWNGNVVGRMNSTLQWVKQA
jgi:hypothetical protein